MDLLGPGQRFTVTGWGYYSTNDTDKSWPEMGAIFRFGSPIRHYPYITRCHSVHYASLSNLSDVFFEFNHRICSMCRLANEMGLRTERAGAFHSHIGQLASSAGCTEFASGHILLLASFAAPTL